MRRPGPGAAAGVRGATLLELLVAMVIMAVVGGAIARAVVAQWRLHSTQVGAAELRDRLRDAADILSAELRSLSPESGDLLEVSDSAIEARETIGAAIVCGVSPAGDVLTLSESGSASAGGGALTWWRDMPRQGDSVAVFVARATATDTFVMHQISGLTWGAACPVGSGLSRPTNGSGAIDLAISPPFAGIQRAGFPIRFLRRTRYSLYKSSSDGRWYLGRREFVAGRTNPWTIVQPIAGPFLPPAAGGGGLHAVARDSSGTPLLTASGLMSARELDLVLRASSQAGPAAPGGGISSQLIDSVRISVAFRNP